MGKVKTKLLLIKQMYRLGSKEAEVKGNKKALVPLLALALLANCAENKPVCRHEALATAIMYAESGKEVRIISYTFAANKRHAEPQVKVGEGWKFVQDGIEADKAWHSKQFAVHYYGLHEYLLHIGIKPEWEGK
jgi:hypothetical protein